MIYAIERGFLVDYLARHARIEKAPDISVLFDLIEGEETKEEGAPPPYRLIGKEAHVSIGGVLNRQRSFIDMLFGMAPTLTYDEIAEAMIRADEDPDVETIILDVDSPGGYVDGVDVAAQAIANVEKPVEARVDNQATSAAYWLASQADEIFALSPAARFGSIGIIATIPRGDSEEYEIIGSADAPVKEDLYHPETKEGRTAWKKELADMHKAFASRVAEGRYTTIAKVNSDFGQGGTVMASDAIEAGMIDGYANIELWGPNCKRKKKKKKSSAESEAPEETGEEPAATAESHTQEAKGMTLDELKKEHSAVYAEAAQDGVKQERERRHAIAQILKSDPENKNLRAVIEEAIEHGTSAVDVAFQTRVQVAIRDGDKLKGENPPLVETIADEAADLTEEEKSICEKMEITPAQYRAQKKKEAK